MTAERSPEVLPERQRAMTDRAGGVTIHVVTGPPCVGKSTYIEERREPGDCVIDYDRLGVAFGSETSHDFPPLIADMAEVAYTAAINAVTAGIDSKAGGAIWIEWPLPPGDVYLLKLRSFVNTFDAVWHRLEEPMEVCLERAVKDGRPLRTYGCIKSYYEHQG